MCLFLVSFLVLFLETALIRWMPAYIRLLAYFSNFILLAAFLGIGVGCLLAGRRGTAALAARLFALFPFILFALVFAVDRLRLEVAVPSTSTIYFSSGTASPVVAVESTRLLPIIFVAVAALFVTVASRLGRELAAHSPLRAYTINLAGSLAGVAGFALVSSFELPPAIWFGSAALAAAPLLFPPRGSRVFAVVNLVLLALTVLVVYRMQGESLWSPYYRITLSQDGPDTVVEVNHIFHQSMAPVAQKEYFYQWPYTVFGDTFDDVLILGAGTGTDVSAALKHGAKHVDAVEIDPVIIRVGTERHPDHPYSDPRVTVVNDDARHFLRTTDRKYDLVVFALIDSLTVQSSFSGVRLESYMFTEQSFAAARDHLKPNGAMVLYNYFREKWLVDRLANSLTAVFGSEPRANRKGGATGLIHVHQDRAYLAVMLDGPRVATVQRPVPLPDLVVADGQSQAPSPARPLVRDGSVAPATDNWPFLYMREPGLPVHYAIALAVVLVVSVVAVWFSLGSDRGRWSWQFFFYGAGFMLLETKSIVQFALLWGSTWTSASLAIAAVLAMALASTLVAVRIDVRRTGAIAAALFALLLVNYLVPVGRVAFASRAAESIFYGALVFSPVFCAGLLFSASFRRSTSASTDFGANLLGAMVGGVGEYLSLIAGYRFLIVVVAVCYLLAVVIADRGLRPSGGLRAP